MSKTTISISESALDGTLENLPDEHVQMIKFYYEYYKTTKNRRVVTQEYTAVWTY